MAKGRKRTVKKELTILAEDFCLQERVDVRNIIENCKCYADGQREIMRIYDRVYMRR